jgi:hypothetical protein
VPSQQPNGQLQTQHSLDAGIYITEALVEGKKSNNNNNNNNNNKFH